MNHGTNGDKALSSGISQSIFQGISKIDNRLKGIIFMLISALGNTLMSVTIKYVPNIPLFEKMLFRNSISLLLAVFLILRSRTSIFVEKDLRPVLFYRCIFGFIGVSCTFYAISNMSLADSNIIGKLTPIPVSIFAAYFLKEKLDRYQILGIVISLIGAGFVIKPSFSMNILPSMFGLIGVILAGASFVMVRYLKGLPPMVIVFYFSIVSVICSIPIVSFDFVIPSMQELIILICTGLMAFVDLFSLTYSYKYGEASEMVIYNYSGIIYAIILGVFIFSEIPDIYSIIGAIIITITAISLYFYNKKRKG